MLQNRHWFVSPWTITLAVCSGLYLVLLMMLTIDSPKPTFPQANLNLETIAKARILRQGNASIVVPDRQTVSKAGLFLKKFYLLFLPPGTVLRPGYPGGFPLGPNFPIVPYYGGYGGNGGYGGYGGYGGGGYYSQSNTALAAPGRKRRPGMNRYKPRNKNRFNRFRPL